MRVDATRGVHVVTLTTRFAKSSPDFRFEASGLLSGPSFLDFRFLRHREQVEGERRRSDLPSRQQDDLRVQRHPAERGALIAL